MQGVERHEILVLGSGEAGKYLAWTMANTASTSSSEAADARRKEP
jgi:hypothetical protein